MARRRDDYLSYLLRLWRTGSGGDAVWRASLENPFTGERQGFASLEDLLAFLYVRTDGDMGRDEGEESGGQGEKSPSLATIFQAEGER